MSGDACTWCGAGVEPGDGFRAYTGVGRATFCRLEHVVPWVLKGGAWDEPGNEGGPQPAPGAVCTQCGEPVGAEGVTLVRHRGELRIEDAFCSVEHLRAWAAAGGHYRP